MISFDVTLHIIIIIGMHSLRPFAFNCEYQTFIASTDIILNRKFLSLPSPLTRSNMHRFRVARTQHTENTNTHIVLSLSVMRKKINNFSLESWCRSTTYSPYDMSDVRDESVKNNFMLACVDLHCSVQMMIHVECWMLIPSTGANFNSWTQS